MASGEGRDVYRVRHPDTDLILCQKVVHYDGKQDTYKTLKRELQLLDECHCPNIVCFYGSFINDSEVNILMEYMDGGCLNNVLHRVGRIEEQWLAPVCHKVGDVMSAAGKAEIRLFLPWPGLCWPETVTPALYFPSGRAQVFVPHCSDMLCCCCDVSPGRSLWGSRTLTRTA